MTTYNVLVRVENGRVIAHSLERRDRTLDPIPLEDARAIGEWATAELPTELVENDRIEVKTHPRCTHMRGGRQCIRDAGHENSTRPSHRYTVKV